MHAALARPPLQPAPTDITPVTVTAILSPVTKAHPLSHPGPSTTMTLPPSFSPQMLRDASCSAKSTFYSAPTLSP